MRLPPISFSIWNANTQTLVGLAQHEKSILTGNEKGELYVWSIETRQITAVVPIAKGTIYSIAVVGEKIILGTKDGFVKVFGADLKSIAEVNVEASVKAVEARLVGTSLEVLIYS